MTGIEREVRRLAPWYHTFDLPGGVVTPGYYDCRPVVAKLPLPASLEGKRCLDAAACEGFWSIELARRGATELVSLDLADTTRQDWQGSPLAERRGAGAGVATEHYEFVRSAIGATNITRVDMNVYDIAPEKLGSFDYVFIGNVLIHLADPARALKAAESVLSREGELLSLEVTSLTLTLLSPRMPLGQLWDRGDLPRWWTPNKAAHRRMLHAAGFEVLDSGGPFFQPFGKGMQARPERIPRDIRDLLWWVAVRPFGPASAWVLARRA